MKMDGKMDVALNISTIQITGEILKTIAKIDEFKGAWKAIGRIAPDRLYSLRRVATIESIGSSTRIEGAKLSDREVDQLLSNFEIKKFSTRDEQEVAGYALVMHTIFANFDAILLTENHIKQLHRDLLKYSDKDERHRGEYKTLPNHVEAFGPDGKSLGVVFQTATPFETPKLMRELVEWTLTSFSENKTHPLIIIAVFVVTFLAIHPFQDGNGRLSRILTTLLLLRAGYVYAPYSSLESVVEQSKKSYYLSLRQTQITIRTDSPNWQPWIIYFLNALKEQKDRLEKKIEKEQILAGALPELSIKILEIAREHGKVTVGEAVKVTGSNRNTIKDHIKNLVKKGCLEKHGAGRGAWYLLKNFNYKLLT
ncbi:MAG: Fic family protein [Deltaproteobacteria bacterium]|nr:Fic family protein [Deltaproteobacteria bacterium]